MSKFTLCIDGNWFLESRTQSLSARMGLLTFQDATFQEDRKALLHALTQSLVKEITMFTGIVDSVIIATDYKSWRRKHSYLKDPLDKTEQVLVGDDELYKANRIANEEINHINKFKVFYEWLILLRDEYNIEWFQSLGCEGDDALYVLNKQLNAAGRSSIFLSTDKDLFQNNMTNSETKACSVFYRKKTSGFKQTRTQTNVFSTIPEVMEVLRSYEKEFNVLDDWTSNNQSSMIPKLYNEIMDEVELDNVGSFLTYKILLGDPGDNVPMIMTRAAGKRQYKTQPRFIHETLDDLMITHESLKREMIYDETFIEELLKRCYSKLHSTKHVVTQINDERLAWYKQRWKENRKLMHIHELEIPIDVFENAKTVATQIITNLKPNTLHSFDEALAKFNFIAQNSVFSIYEDEILDRMSAYNKNE